MNQNRVKYFIVSRGFYIRLLLIALVGISAHASCERIGDSLRSYGEKERRIKARKLSEEDIEKWKRDLILSEERVIQLNEAMHDLVQESNLQGMLAWKIAKAYTREKRYDMAAEYYEAAFEGRMPVGETVDPLSTENSLPFYRNALKRHIPDVELLFDAGLAYANASRELGWEESRWRTAVLIFERMLEMKPDDLRSPYQLALLYAFTTKSDLKNTERALGYLERILKSEENNIPARFAMAHIHVMEGHYEKGRSEYVTIKDVIENMFNAGLISGSYQRNPQYQKAVQNIEKLDLCIEGSPQCELMR